MISSDENLKSPAKKSFISVPYQKALSWRPKNLLLDWHFAVWLNIHAGK